MFHTIVTLKQKQFSSDTFVLSIRKKILDISLLKGKAARDIKVKHIITQILSRTLLFS